MRDICVGMFCGVSLTIVPLFVLGAELTLKDSTKSIQTSCDTLTVHLDEIYNRFNKQRLVNSFLVLPVDTQKTIMLLSLPQKIVNDKVWMGFLKKLIKNGLTRLACVDVMHLFFHYGLSFKQEFAMLSSTLFCHLIIDSGVRYKTKIPVLFMTDTCTQRIFDSCWPSLP